MTGDDDRSALAAEYVLGTLTEEERLRIIVRLATDAGLRAEVLRWERRLLPLTEQVAEVAPPPAAWRAIERTLALAPEAGSAAAPHRAEPAAARSPAPLPAAGRERAPRAARPVRQSLPLGFWRAAALAMTGVAAVLAGLLVYDRASLPDAPGAGEGERYVAVVDRDGRQPALLVTVDTGEGTVSVRSVTAEAPSDKTYEIWYVADDAATPRSLGTLDATEDMKELQGAFRALQGASGGTIAVTEEPPGGSPTGRATGPVVFSGRLIRAE